MSRAEALRDCQERQLSDPALLFTKSVFVRGPEGAELDPRLRPGTPLYAWLSADISSETRAGRLAALLRAALVGRHRERGEEAFRARHALLTLRAEDGTWFSLGLYPAGSKSEAVRSLWRAVPGELVSPDPALEEWLASPRRFQGLQLLGAGRLGARGLELLRSRARRARFRADEASGRRVARAPAVPYALAGRGEGNARNCASFLQRFFPGVVRCRVHGGFSAPERCTPADWAAVQQCA